MQVSRRNSDMTTTWECPLCLKHETVWEENSLTHAVGDLTCLQRQITALQETVQSCVEELRGLGVEF
ncbi:MAG: hypothetical protein E6K18_08075 [Methanobacteriota archaeon]|nr:MAG: hypothetical protein E6K18_08075 [Euryarchaeota archaeon]